MHVLIVGAGSVGQVYGYYLQQGGARVTYLVRSHHLERLRSEPLVLYPWNRKDRTSPVHWDAFEVTDDLAEALPEDGGPELVVVATSATALMAGTWFEDLVARLGDRTLVSLQPGTSIPDWIHARVPREQVVWGLVSLSAWPAPLPGQDLPEPGQGWWVPWGGKLGFSGPPERTRAVVAAMTAGGAPAAVRDDVQKDQAFMGPVLANIVIPFELAGWSMDRLAADRDLLGLAHRCMEECWAWAEHTSGSRRPFLLRLLGPGTLRFLLERVLPWTPVDMEVFLRVHYTKVAEQTPVLLAQRIEDIQEAGLPTDALETLLQRLLVKRREAGEPAATTMEQLAG